MLVGQNLPWKNDSDDNGDVDVGASCANETEVGENNESHDCKSSEGTEATSTKFCEEFGKQSCFYEKLVRNIHFVGSFLNDT